jgi:hypothetical protein
LIEQETDIAVQLKKDPSKEGRKDGGLTIALSIAGLALSAIGTIVSVISYWRSQQPKYSVSITCGNIKVVLDNVSPAHLQTVIQKLEEQNRSSSSDLTVLLAEE